MMLVQKQRSWFTYWYVHSGDGLFHLAGIRRALCHCVWYSQQKVQLNSVRLLRCTCLPKCGTISNIFGSHQCHCQFGLKRHHRNAREFTHNECFSTAFHTISKKKDRTKSVRRIQRVLTRPAPLQSGRNGAFFYVGPFWFTQSFSI